MQTASLLHCYIVTFFPLLAATPAKMSEGTDSALFSVVQELIRNTFSSFSYETGSHIAHLGLKL